MFNSPLTHIFYFFNFIDSGNINKNSWPTSKEHQIWRKNNFFSFLFIVAYPQLI